MELIVLDFSLRKVTTDTLVIGTPIKYSKSI